MPGPGHRKHKIRKSHSTGTARDLSDVNVPGVLDVFNVEEVNNAANWEGIVLVLCRLFELPSE